MPRKIIEIPARIEYLSILDQQGQVDPALDPGLPAELQLKLFRAMLLGRRFDQRLLNLQRQGRIGTFAPITGQEASQIGAVAVLRPGDWVAPSFREMAAEIWRGRSMESIIIYYGGFDEGAEIAAERNDLPVAIPVGSQTLHATGVAWALKYRRSDNVAMTFFGDGATSQGDFHEALNFAGVFDAPVIFVCQNNQWAISIPRKHQTRSATLAQKALAYGIPGIQVDGNDVLAVYQAAAEAAQRARAGQGPSLIECVTYRMMMHTTADDPKRYRSETEVEEWSRRDPLTRFQIYLEAQGVLAAGQAAALEAEVLREIQEAVERAEARMQGLGDPMAMFEHTFAERPPHLERQRQHLARRIAATPAEVSHG